MCSKLYSFDFDATLFDTPDENLGKKIWEEKTGKKWPYIGWWSKSETLDNDIFEIKLNDWVYKEYLKSSSEDNSLRVLITGRLNFVPNMRNNVLKTLRKDNITFDEILTIKNKDEEKINGKEGVYLNWGGDTFNFKKQLFEKLIEKTNCEEFIMYDDRIEHIERFKNWAKSKDFKITIIDVINKNKFIYGNKSKKTNQKI